MTFRTGFAVTRELSLSDWRLENAAGKPLVGSVRTPRRADRGTMIEIDTQRGRARMPFGRGVYLANNLTPELRRSVVNLAECATKAIDAIMKAQDADLVLRAASSWIENSQRFWWTRNLPWQLEMLDFANGQPFRAVRVTEKELFFVIAENAGTFEWVVPIGDVNLDDLGFDDEMASVSITAGIADLRVSSTDRPADY
jgi:hypothetical protein